MRILVTGGTSRLGGAVAERLTDRGDDVTVMQRRPSALGFREVLGDVADAAAVARAVVGQDVVVHLAAKVDVVGRWAEYRRANVEGTRAVVAACRAAGVGRLVQVSSPSVAHAAWPQVDPDLLVAETVTCVFQVQGKVRGRIEVAPDVTEDALREAALADEGVQRALAGREVAKVIVRAPKLVSIVPGR